jgi:hypothetical protein
MADPLQVMSSLQTLADRYTIFEPDQVLTHGQLNSVTDYLDDQTRLSRVALDGVGLIAGLHVAQVAGGVRVTRGLGVTTDGDLMRLPVDTSYDRVRPYDTTAPVYPPFYRPGDGDGTPATMLALRELVPVGESDVLAQPLSTVPGGLADKAVLMLMETVVNDPDLCSGTDCDNLGRDALHRLRLLLITRSDAQALLDRIDLAPMSERAQRLTALAMRRPALARDVTTTGVLASRFRDSASASLNDLRTALPQLAANCPEVLMDMFASDPTPRWLGTLADLAGRFAGTSTGLQVWYGFVKDLIDQWNALREALLGDDSIVLPDLAAFPKHLLLGALAAPREQRTGLYPSPLDATSRQEAAHARFLVWKLDALIRSFVLPTDTVTRITPSVADDHPLEERAIPWHYRVLDDAPINAAWNFALSSRHQEGQNLGYRADAWASTARARDPLSYAIGGNDFFRVEGHLGRPVEAVGDEVRKIIGERNLPLRVQEVLLHNDRRLIRRRPPVRYTPLHSLHYMLRQDVAFRIDESQSFGKRYLDDVTAGVGNGQVPANTDSGASVVTLASGALDAVGSVQSVAKPVLSQPTYSGYKTQLSGPGAVWKTSYSTSLETVSNSRANLGHLSRADFSSPYDSLIVANQPHWIDWLDDLIQAGEDRADDKLLFAQFVQDHPGIDHLGGVWRGGTLVLVYDDGGHVVGDFALPYPAAESETPEPAEPPLGRPPYRPPVAVKGGIRVLRPLDLKVQDSVALQRQSFQIDLDKQTANITGLVQGAFVPSNAVDPKKTLIPGLTTGDQYLDFATRDMASQQERVKQLQEIVAQPSLPADARALAERDLGRAQADLATAVGNVAGRVVTSNVDLDSATGKALTQQLAGGVTLIQDGGAKAQLNTQLAGLAAPAGSSQAALIGNLQKVGRLG